MQALNSVLGPVRCIPAPDIGTNDQHMAWMFDQYSRMNGAFACYQENTCSCSGCAAIHEGREEKLCLLVGM
jgi:hypothetical protein